MTRVPVLLILYKKPSTTRLVLNSLRKNKVKKLYISLNIPEKNNSEDIANHKKVIELIKTINWDCKIKINKRKFHLSSYESVFNSVKWFFKNEKYGIILEDDTLPSSSFFEFCSKLLIKYKNNHKISQICGTSFLNLRKYKYNYRFSNYHFCWGYATWKRSFQNYDTKMKKWKYMRKKNKLKKIINDKNFIIYWTKIFNDLFQKKKKAFDYKWLYSNWSKNKLAIIPNKQLVQNIGYLKDATHTKEEDKDWYVNIKPQKMKYLNRHPKNIVPDINYDLWVTEKIYRIKPTFSNKFFNFKKKVRYKLNKYF